MRCNIVDGSTSAVGACAAGERTVQLTLEQVARLEGASEIKVRQRTLQGFHGLTAERLEDVQRRTYIYICGERLRDRRVLVEKTAAKKSGARIEPADVRAGNGLPTHIGEMRDLAEVDCWMRRDRHAQGLCPSERHFVVSRLREIEAVHGLAAEGSWKPAWPE